VLSDAILPILAAAIFLAGVCILLLLWVNIFREMRGERRMRVGPTWRIDLRRAIAIIVALGMIATANVVFWVNTQLRLYSAVVPGVPLGTITIIHESGMLPRLVYASTDREGRPGLEVFPMREAEFRLQGERIRWSRHLKWLGLDDHFKLSRIEFFPATGKILSKSSYAVDVRQGPTTLFDQLERWKSWFPFVQIDTVSTELWNADSEYSRSIYLNPDRIVSR
jgi:hypothetical protein